MPVDCMFCYPTTEGLRHFHAICNLRNLFAAVSEQMLYSDFSYLSLRTVQIINVDCFIKLVQSESPYCIFETFIEVVIYSRVIVVGFL